MTELRKNAVPIAWGTAALLCWLLPSYQLFQLTQLIIYALALLGLNLLIGTAGQFAIAQGAFYGIGATAAAIMMQRWELPGLVALPGATLAAAVAGLLFGMPMVRLAGPYLGLASFSLALAVPQVMKYCDSWTGGIHGLAFSHPGARIPGFLDRDQGLYLLSLGAFAAAWWLSSRVMQSRLGLALRAMRDHPLAASAFGVNLRRDKARIFGLSAGFAGLAGGLQAYASSYVAVSMFDVSLSLTWTAALILGGVASQGGALLGALSFALLAGLTRNLSSTIPGALFGACLIGCAMFMPYGLAGFLTTRWGRLHGPK